MNRHTFSDPYFVHLRAFNEALEKLDRHRDELERLPYASENNEKRKSLEAAIVIWKAEVVRHNLWILQHTGKLAR